MSYERENAIVDALKDKVQNMSSRFLVNTQMNFAIAKDAKTAGVFYRLVEGKWKIMHAADIYMDDVANLLDGVEAGELPLKENGC